MIVDFITVVARRFNHYDTLGVTRTSTEHDIKKAYRQLAKEYHPDRPRGNKDVFQRVTEAYECLSSKDKRATYDNEHFPAVEEEAANEFVATKPTSTGAKKREPYYTPEFQQAMHNYQKAEKKWSDRWNRGRLTVLYIKQNPLRVLLFVCVTVAASVTALYYTEQYLELTCAKYYFDRHERAITLPGSAEHRAKVDYIERMIDSRIPDDPLEAIEKFGVTRVEWVIDFYKLATNAIQRGENSPDLRRAVKFLPFVTLAFLEKRIPLDPRHDFDDSYECKLCELVYGQIYKFYPDELLEEYPTRASYFVREYLPERNYDLLITPDKMINPNFVDPVTGKKNNADGWQEPELDLAGNYFAQTAAQKYGMSNRDYHHLLVNVGAKGDTPERRAGKRGAWEQ